MRPIVVTTDVAKPLEEVYDFLDVIANHELFTDHMLKDWEYAGPERGVGAQARVRVTTAGKTDEIKIEVVSAHPLTEIVEQNIGAGGRRRATGTYTLEALPNGATRIAFEYRWLEAPLSERIAAPLVRGFMRRQNQRAMDRLGALLADHPASTSTTRVTGRPA